MKYYALQKNPGEEPEFIEVKGRKISFKGFEDFEFFWYCNLYTQAYHVIEARSGTSAGTNYFSLKEAKQVAESNLTKTGKEAFQKLIDAQIKKYGLSPRYEDKP